MFLLSVLVAHNSTFDDFHLQILFSFLIKKMKITLIKIKSVRAQWVNVHIRSAQWVNVHIRIMELIKSFPVIFCIITGSSYQKF